jgi:methylmalonyl-CoA mutase N-terminal domain/subunit
VSGYHIRESGSDAVQEIAFTFANAVAYLDAAVDRGVAIDAVAPTLYTFLSVDIDLLREIAKFRAARRVWARLIRERYAAHDPRSEQLRIFVFTAGSSLTAQQPLNNVVRATVETLAAALAGVQTMHVCAYDEAVGVPTEAATLALAPNRSSPMRQPDVDCRSARRLARHRGADRRAGVGDRNTAGGYRSAEAFCCIESGWPGLLAARPIARRSRSTRV